MNSSSPTHSASQGGMTHPLFLLGLGSFPLSSDLPDCSSSSSSAGSSSSFYLKRWPAPGLSPWTSVPTCSLVDFKQFNSIEHLLHSVIPKQISRSDSRPHSEFKYLIASLTPPWVDIQAPQIRVAKTSLGSHSFHSSSACSFHLCDDAATYSKVHVGTLTPPSLLQELPPGSNFQMHPETHRCTPPA